MDLRGLQRLSGVRFGQCFRRWPFARLHRASARPGSETSDQRDCPVRAQLPARLPLAWGITAPVALDWQPLPTAALVRHRQMLDASVARPDARLSGISDGCSVGRTRGRPLPLRPRTRTPPLGGGVFACGTVCGDLVAGIGFEPMTFRL